jgi:kynurenine formamidase
MHIQVAQGNKTYKADLDAPLFISIPLKFNQPGPNCFYAPMPEATPVRAGDFVGSIDEGGLLNFMNLRINPHGNGTHTECQSHIYPGSLTVHDCLDRSFFLARLISVYPTRRVDGDLVIGASSLMLEPDPGVEALIIRTLPNDVSKNDRPYSGTNPPYLSEDAVKEIVRMGYRHLLVDVPSLDREEDGGQLLAHKAFWREENMETSKKTVTELIFVPNEIKDGLFLLSIQIAHFVLDVSPSRVALYDLK